MNFLRRNYELVERLFPGLIARLEAIPFEQMESRANPAIAEFRCANGPALVVPSNLGGMGLSAVDAIRVQQVLAASAPSMALATNMHHFTVALLSGFAVSSPQIPYLLRNVANNHLYLASGFAEGVAGRSTLAPTMTAQQTKHGYILNGSKKPCSLSRSMDVLTVSAQI